MSKIRIQLEREQIAWQKLKMCNESLKISFVLRNGCVHTAQKLPVIYERMEPKKCFRNAALLAMSDPKLRYVEGYALPSIDLPLAHAWCVDQKGCVIDPTWPEPENNYYMGVAFVNDDLCHWISKLKTWGLFVSQSGYNMELFRQYDPELIAEWEQQQAE